MWLKKAELVRFQERACTAFADAAQGLNLAQKPSPERLELARAFLRGYTRGSLDAGVDATKELPLQEESLLRSMVEYALYAHLFAYKMKGLMSPQEFLKR